MVRVAKTKKKAKNVARKPAKRQVKKPVASKAKPLSKKRSSVKNKKLPEPKKKISAQVRSPRSVKSPKTKPQPSPASKKIMKSVISSQTKTVLKNSNAAAKKAPLPKADKPAAKSSPASKAAKPAVKQIPVKKAPKPVVKKLPVRKPAVKQAAVEPRKARVKSSAISAGLKKKKVQDLLGAVRVSLRKKPKPVPSQPAAHVERPAELPQNYGDNLIYFMVRDPAWAYAYWELQPHYVENARKRLGGTWDEICTILRVFDITEKGHVTFQDLYLGGITNHWYVNTQPNRSYFVEIGLLHKDGRFASLAKSNPVLMPRSQMSDVLDEQWMDIDFDKVYALSGGFDPGKSSMEVRRMMEEKISGGISSGSGAGLMSSMSSPGAKGLPAKDRKFWFWLDCEVIVYGGTEPDAKVTFQGKVIQLRPDGTFSFRFALPDGKFVFDAKAESADGIEERVITPVVQRETYRPEPVIRPAQGS